LRALDEEKRTPSTIAHLWSADDDGASDDPAGVARAQELGFFSLLHLAQAISAEDLESPLRLTVVSAGCAQVAGEPVSPAKATVLGPVRVIPRELPNVACRLVDVRRPPPGSFQEERLVRALADEVSDAPTSAVTDAVVAYRGVERWVQTFEPIDLARAGTAPAREPGGPDRAFSVAGSRIFEGTGVLDRPRRQAPAFDTRG